MKISKGLGTVALMALSVGTSWVLLAPDAVPPAAAAPATAADGRGFSVLAWPQPVPEAPPAATAPAGATVPAIPSPKPQTQTPTRPETDPMETTLEDDPPPQ